MKLGIVCIACCHLLAWIKGHAKYVWGWELSIWMYWLTFGFVTNFLGLTGWWRICDSLDRNYWLATVICVCIGFTVSITLNTISYGANWRAALALVLVACAGLLVK